MDSIENQQADIEFAPSPDPQPSSEYREYADAMIARIAKQMSIPASLLVDKNTNYCGIPK